MAESQDMEKLMEEGAALREALARVGDFRPGTLTSRFRKCGKPTCHCAREDDPGHGPKWVLVRTVDGKTRNWSIPDEAVEETQTQVAEYQRFRQLTGALIEVNERLCEERLAAKQGGVPERKKGALRPPSPRKSLRRPTG